MDRRAFLGPFGLLAVPLAAHAQQAGKIARVGILWVGSISERRAAQALFDAAMGERGWVEGRNLVIERRYVESADQLRAAAAELVGLKLNVLVVQSGGMALSVRLETKHTPIVIVSSGMDLVGIGLAASLARPGGNVTGSQDLQSETFGKRLQLLKECVPKLSRVASLIERATTTGVFTPEELALSDQRRADTARSLGLELHPFIAFRPEDFPTLFRDMVKNGDRGLIVVASPFTFVHRKQIADLAANHRIATISGVRSYVDAGGLMSYGAKSLAVWRRTAAFVDKILKGANPGDLPVEQSTEFELVINLKTAKALGLTIPPALLQRADQVIE